MNENIDIDTTFVPDDSASHEWTERDETRRIKSRYEVIPIPQELLRELGFVEGGAGNGAQI